MKCIRNLNIYGTDTFFFQFEIFKKFQQKKGTNETNGSNEYRKQLIKTPSKLITFLMKIIIIEFRLR